MFVIFWWERGFVNFIFDGLHGGLVFIAEEKIEMELKINLKLNENWKERFQTIIHYPRAANHKSSLKFSKRSKLLIQFQPIVKLNPV